MARSGAARGHAGGRYAGPLRRTCRPVRHRAWRPMAEATGDGCVRYYYGEHEAAYRRLREEGMSQWSDLFGETENFDAFPNRGFLEDALARLELRSPAEVDVLEYGCGTGPAACFLAARGFQVDAVDLIPEAIMLAQRFAGERGLE